ncbi:MAG: DUF2339 domain-containing protein [Pseudomonadota bacterium]
MDIYALMGLLALVLVLTVFIGAICGLIAIRQVGRLRRETFDLQQRIDWLVRKAQSPPGESSAFTPTGRVDAADVESLERQSTVEDVPQPEAVAKPVEWRRGWSAADPVVHATPVNPPAAAEPSRVDAWFTHLVSHWMTWLGGGCVALAGIFMVRYSMDRGWLGPLARILLALLTGAGLLTTAEFFRRRHGGTQPALAALAGAGSITLYGALLAAMRLYDLIQPGTAFILMAIVAVGTMAMALLHGPLLAAFGILGAYLVPVLVSTGSGAINTALIYSLIVSLSALLLLRHVYRAWLWWGFVIGAISWWLLSLDFAVADITRSLYLVALAYLVAAVPYADWLLRTDQPLAEAGYSPRELLRALKAPERSAAATLVVLALASGASILAAADTSAPWLLGLPFFAFSLWLARTREVTFALPWASLLVTVGAWLLAYVQPVERGYALASLEAGSAMPFMWYLLSFAGVAAAGAIWLFALGRRAPVWASLAALGPMLLVTLAYLLNARPETDAFWGLATAVLGLAYLTLAASTIRRSSAASLVVWLFIGGHFGLGIAAAMVFESASLTLAIAAQVLSLAWVIRTFELPTLGWLLKLVVLIVIARLTFNPWLPEYPVGVHWSLWTYGGSALLTGLAAYWLRQYPKLARWAEGAALHLLVLTIWSEVRYQLYDGSVYANTFSFAEATLTQALAAVMALVYHYRAAVSQSLAWLYRLYARVLVVAALVVYGVLVLNLLSSNAWLTDAVGTTPIANVLLPAFGLPILLGLAFARWFTAQFRQVALGYSALAGLIFVSLQVRHLWTGTVALDAPPIAGGELYTYSAVWLVIAITTLLAGSWRLGPTVYKAGLALLAIVIGKLFLVDLSDLDGLLRVASFMGLGLSLLGVAYLHQRLGGSTQPAEPEPG